MCLCLRGVRGWGKEGGDDSIRAGKGSVGMGTDVAEMRGVGWGNYSHH